MYINRATMLAASVFLLAGCAAGIGMFLLADYTYRPGDSGEVIQRFHTTAKDSSQEKLQNELLLFYHPRCPCSLASIRQFERIVPRLRNQVTIRAYAFYPRVEGEGWIDTRNTRVLSRVPGVEIHPDPDGDICWEFGVRTSGHVLYFSHSGDLVFSGGITPGRGHEGDSRATQVLLQRVNGQQTEPIEVPVFGCPFFHGS